TLHLIGQFDAATAIDNLKQSDEWVRAWTIQLAFESPKNIERLVRETKDKGLKADPDMNTLVESDPSPLVRLFVASAAQRAPSEEVRARIVERLLKHSEDAGDH